jgi:hypothetical protein
MDILDVFFLDFERWAAFSKSVYIIFLSYTRTVLQICSPSRLPPLSNKKLSFEII